MLITTRGTPTKDNSANRLTITQYAADDLSAATFDGIYRPTRSGPLTNRPIR